MLGSIGRRLPLCSVDAERLKGIQPSFFEVFVHRMTDHHRDVGAIGTGVFTKLLIHRDREPESTGDTNWQPVLSFVLPVIFGRFKSHGVLGERFDKLKLVGVFSEITPLPSTPRNW